MPVRRLFAYALGALPAVSAAVPSTADPQGPGAPDGLARRVDAVVLAEMDAQMIPGLALLVARHGKVELAKGFGLANVELHVPVTRKTLFQTGSLGKMFTAAGVLLQVDKGTVALDDRIAKWFPDAPGAWKDVTVRHLLNHTSGIANYTRDMYMKMFNATEEDFARAAYELPPDFAPGTRHSYSNTSYVLLGILLRNWTGRFYGDYLVEELFRPLGMRTARPISEADIIPRRAAGYRLEGGRLRNQEWVPQALNSTADGALYMSLEDYAAWDRAVRSKALISAKGWEEAFRPAVLESGEEVPYGFGWRLGVAGGLPYRYHGGAWQGFKTWYSMYEKGGLTVVVLTNLVDADTQKIADAVAAAADPALAVAKL
ncbi:penicillin-binding protein [Hyaloraphidium curvatum]|nr:penicillin-binding protein [Hyaloraphidium curvatum]